MRDAAWRWVLARKDAFSNRSREKRMKVFLDLMGIEGGERVIDLGGSPLFWASCPHPLKLTIVNLPGRIKPASLEAMTKNTIHEITFIEGDACNVDMFGDDAFDIAVSNSVIEHVGDAGKQAELAAEARRLAPSYWVQTPAIWFPIEAHTYMPFWWFWPTWMREMALRRWRRMVPVWSRMIETTTVIPLRDLRAMFPDGRLHVERRLGFTKSYALYRVAG